MLERSALDRWGKGDPSGFLELYATEITYFDPLTATRIGGHQAMVITTVHGSERSKSPGTRC